MADGPVNFIAKTTASTWTCIAGQGIDSQTSSQMFTGSITIRNIGGDATDIFLAIISGTSAPSADDAAGVAVRKNISDDGLVQWEGLVLKPGWTAWMLTDNVCTVQMMGFAEVPS